MAEEKMSLSTRISVIGGGLTILTVLAGGAAAGYGSMRQHWIDDKAREDARVAIEKRLDAADQRLSRLRNRVAVLEGIDYKTLPKEYALEIYYANGEPQDAEPRRRVD